MSGLILPVDVEKWPKIRQSLLQLKLITDLEEWCGYIEAVLYTYLHGAYSGRYLIHDLKDYLAGCETGEKWRVLHYSLPNVVELVLALEEKRREYDILYAEDVTSLSLRKDCLPSLLACAFLQLFSCDTINAFNHFFRYQLRSEHCLGAKLRSLVQYFDRSQASSYHSSTLVTYCRQVLPYSGHSTMTRLHSCRRTLSTVHIISTDDSEQRCKYKFTNKRTGSEQVYSVCTLSDRRYSTSPELLLTTLLLPGLEANETAVVTGIQSYALNRTEVCRIDPDCRDNEELASLVARACCVFAEAGYAPREQRSDSSEEYYSASESLEDDVSEHNESMEVFSPDKLTQRTDPPSVAYSPERNYDFTKRRNSGPLLRLVPIETRRRGSNPEGCDLVLLRRKLSNPVESELRRSNEVPDLRKAGDYDVYRRRGSANGEVGLRRRGSNHSEALSYDVARRPGSSLSDVNVNYDCKRRGSGFSDSYDVKRRGSSYSDVDVKYDATRRCGSGYSDVSRRSSSRSSDFSGIDLDRRRSSNLSELSSRRSSSSTRYSSDFSSEFEEYYESFQKQEHNHIWKTAIVEEESHHALYEFASNLVTDILGVGSAVAVSSEPVDHFNTEQPSSACRPHAVRAQASAEKDEFLVSMETPAFETLSTTTSFMTPGRFVPPRTTRPPVHLVPPRPTTPVFVTSLLSEMVSSFPKAGTSSASPVTARESLTSTPRTVTSSTTPTMYRETPPRQATSSILTRQSHVTGSESQVRHFVDHMFSNLGAERPPPKSRFSTSPVSPATDHRSPSSSTQLSPNRKLLDYVDNLVARVVREAIATWHQEYRTQNRISLVAGSMVDGVFDQLRDELRQSIPDSLKLLQSQTRTHAPTIVISDPVSPRIKGFAYQFSYEVVSESRSDAAGVLAHYAGEPHLRLRKYAETMVETAFVDSYQIILKHYVKPLDTLTVSSRSTRARSPPSVSPYRRPSNPSPGATSLRPTVQRATVSPPPRPSSTPGPRLRRASRDPFTHPLPTSPPTRVSRRVKSQSFSQHSENVMDDIKTMRRYNSLGGFQDPDLSRFALELTHSDVNSPQLDLLDQKSPSSSSSSRISLRHSSGSCSSWSSQPSLTSPSFDDSAARRQKRTSWHPSVLELDHRKTRRSERSKAKSDDPQSAVHRYAERLADEVLHQVRWKFRSDDSSASVDTSECSLPVSDSGSDSVNQFSDREPSHADNLESLVTGMMVELWTRKPDQQCLDYVGHLVDSTLSEARQCLKDGNRKVGENEEMALMAHWLAASYSNCPELRVLPAEGLDSCQVEAVFSRISDRGLSVSDLAGLLVQYCQHHSDVRLFTYILQKLA